MEITPILTSFLYVSLLFSVILDTLACPGKHFPKSLPERVVSSDVIIWGEIVKKNVDHMRSDGTSVAYSAEVRVHCVLKGRVSSRIMIDDIGNVIGKCKAIDFIENEQYIMLLRVDRQGRYVPTFDQEMYNQITMDRIFGYCGINISQPMGEAQKESSYVDCPNIPSRRAINKKQAGRCSPLDRVQRWELAGPQPPRVTIIPVINARTRELERPTRRPGGRRRKGKGRMDDETEVGRRDRDQAGTPADSSKPTGKRRHQAYPTQPSVVAIIYQQRKPPNHASAMTPQTITTLLTVSLAILGVVKGF